MESNKLFEELDHQDWKTIVIKTKKENKKENNSNKVNVIKKLDVAVESSKMKHDLFTREFSKTLIKKRSNLNLTQKELAQILNIPLQKINEIESFKCKYDPQLNNKIKKFINK
tara:strand:- start:7001 stop:7339 length:339 start_codon:yes stop_codon:yes gene_type:complete